MITGAGVGRAAVSDGDAGQISDRTLRRAAPGNPSAPVTGDDGVYERFPARVRASSADTSTDRHGHAPYAGPGLRGGVLALHGRARPSDV